MTIAGSLSRTIPSRKETVKFVWIRRPFLKMCQEFRDARKKMRPMDSCFWCKHKFEDGEVMNLAAREKGANVLLCDKCADEAEEGS